MFPTFSCSCPHFFPAQVPSSVATSSLRTETLRSRTLSQPTETATASERWGSPGWRFWKMLIYDLSKKSIHIISTYWSSSIMFYILFLINLYLYLYICVCVYMVVCICFWMFMWYITSCNWCNLYMYNKYIYNYIYMEASAGNINWRLYNISLICV